jgi:hypothetical protein
VIDTVKSRTGFFFFCYVSIPSRDVFLSVRLLQFSAPDRVPFSKRNDDGWSTCASGNSVRAERTNASDRNRYYAVASLDRFVLEARTSYREFTFVRIPRAIRTINNQLLKKNKSREGGRLPHLPTGFA